VLIREMDEPVTASGTGAILGFATADISQTARIDLVTRR
jgi:hypothetical protein